MPSKSNCALPLRHCHSVAPEVHGKKSAQQRLFLNPCQKFRALLATLAVMFGRRPVGNVLEMGGDVIGAGHVSKINAVGLQQLGGGEDAGGGGENHAGG